METPPRNRSWSTRTLMTACLVTALLGFAAARFVRPQPSLAARPANLVPAASAFTTPTPAMARADALSAEISTNAAQDNYERIAALPRTPETERHLAAILLALARHDPRSAMSLALAERNWAWRADLRDAVLRGWAENDPDAAAQWSQSLAGDDRLRALTAVLTGAASDPERAIAIAGRLSDADPAHATDYGSAILHALAEHGAFDAAVRFVTAQPASPLRIEQADTAFALWARDRPDEAAAAAATISDPELRQSALHGVGVGWSEADPVAAANYAAQLPAGDARAAMLANAVPRWVEHDPVAAATWLENHTGPDFDMGVVAVATLPSMIDRRPDVAMALAQSISDAPLRTNTLHNLALKWAEHDAAGAAKYVQSSGNFSAAEQHSLLAEIGSPPGA